MRRRQLAAPQSPLKFSEHQLASIHHCLYDARKMKAFPGHPKSRTSLPARQETPSTTRLISSNVHKPTPSASAGQSGEEYRISRCSSQGQGSARKARRRPAPGQRATPRPPVQQIPVFAAVPTGALRDAVESATDTVSLDVETLGIQPSDRVFGVVLADESLRPLDLCAGDLLVFEHGRQPRGQDIVAALIDGRSVIGSLAPGGGGAHLEGSRRGGIDIPATARIQGVLVALVRRR